LKNYLHNNINKHLVEEEHNNIKVAMFNDHENNWIFFKKVGLPYTHKSNLSFILFIRKVSKEKIFL
jgi:hypothetical protein